MGYTLSLVLNGLDYADGSLGGLQVHGANLAIAAHLRQFARSPEVEALEIFLPPAVMIQQDVLARAATELLPAERQGKGILRFYPLQALPEVWSDGQERIVWTIDPEWLPRDRYLRDRFAAGPAAVVCDTHALGYHKMHVALDRVARAPVVPFDSIVALTTTHAEAFRKAAGERAMRVDVVPRGVNTVTFKPASAEVKAFSRESLRLPGSGCVVLYLGRLTPNSKADLRPLVQAFSEAAGAEDILVIAGVENVSGYAQSLQVMAAELGIGSQVKIQVGVDPSLRTVFYAAADIFAFPGDTVQEAFGNTVIEAMASGLPVVSSDWDGFKDVVEDGETGYRVPTWIVPASERVSALSPAENAMTDYLFLAQSVWVDTGALADRLRILISSPETRSRLGAMGRRRVDEAFTWAHVMTRLFALFDELLGLARKEDAEACMERQALANQVGLPTDFGRIFENYATGVVQPDRPIALTSFGRSVRDGRAKLNFYEETLAVVRPELIESLLRQGMEEGQPVGQLVAYTRNGALTDDEIWFHLALLLKRGLFELL